VVLKNTGMAGTLESSDIMVVIEPKKHTGIEIILESPVERQFGDQIRKVILDTLDELGVKSAVVRAKDRGALDCVIKARTQAAVFRAAGSKDYNWGAIKR
jgi:citrate lyase subunit gamma (acyl carrier protein)